VESKNSKIHTRPGRTKWRSSNLCLAPRQLKTFSNNSNSLSFSLSRVVRKSRKINREVFALTTLCQTLNLFLSQASRRLATLKREEGNLLKQISIELTANRKSRLCGRIWKRKDSQSLQDKRSEIWFLPSSPVWRKSRNLASCRPSTNLCWPNFKTLPKFWIKRSLASKDIISPRNSSKKFPTLQISRMSPKLCLVTLKT